MKQYWPYVVRIGYVGVMGWLGFRNQWVGWLVGIGLAWGLSLFDRMLYAWWLKPFEQLSIQIQYWTKRKDVMVVWRLLRERGHEQTRLVLKSLGFGVVWPLLVIYITTSTGSVIAAGMAMGLGLELALALMKDWQAPQTISQWYCWQIKRTFTTRETRIVAGGFIFIWLVFTVALLGQ